MSSPSNKKTRRLAKPIKAQLIFNPQSFDSQFATLNASSAAMAERLERYNDSLKYSIAENNEELTYKLNSHDANLSERLDRQDGVLEEIKVQTTSTNGRVTQIESGRRYSKGWLAGVAAAISVLGSGIATILWHYLVK